MIEHDAARLLVRTITVTFAAQTMVAEDRDDMHPDLATVCRLAYRLLLVSFKSHREAEIIVSQYIDVFIRHVRTHGPVGWFPARLMCGCIHWCV